MLRVSVHTVAQVRSQKNDLLIQQNMTGQVKDIAINLNHQRGINTPPDIGLRGGVSVFDVLH